MSMSALRRVEATATDDELEVLRRFAAAGGEIDGVSTHAGLCYRGAMAALEACLARGFLAQDGAHPWVVRLTDEGRRQIGAGR